MGSHLFNEKGKLHFQTDKYVWCPRDFVPLKVTDPNALLPLYCYAQLAHETDPEFSDDLADLVKIKGFKPEARLNPLLRAVFEREAESAENFDESNESVGKLVADMDPGELYMWYRHVVARMNTIMEDL